MCFQSAIGSAAAASEQHFLPYAERTLVALKALMQLTSDKDLVVRARATEMVGVIAVAVGKEAMAPVLPGFIEDALKVHQRHCFLWFFLRSVWTDI